MEPEERGLTPRNKRNLTIFILTAVDQGSDLYTGKTYYRRPYTVVTIQEGKRFMGVGCSKVCRPDKWDPEKGEEIARARAARDLAEIMMENIVVAG